MHTFFHVYRKTAGPGLEMFAEMFNIIMSWPGPEHGLYRSGPTARLDIKGLHRTAGHQINLEDKTLECKFSDARMPLAEGNWEIRENRGLSCSSRTRANRKLCQDVCDSHATDPAASRLLLGPILPTATCHCCRRTWHEIGTLAKCVLALPFGFRFWDVFTLVARALKGRIRFRKYTFWMNSSFSLKWKTILSIINYSKSPIHYPI